ncbi:putative ribonuclease H-like domain-containing protein [Tanacetum coccineum]
MTPRAVLLRTGLKSFSTAKPFSTSKPVYTAHPKPTVHYARPKTHFYKQAQSTIQRPSYKQPGLTKKYFNQQVNTGRPRVVNTARSYREPINTVRPFTRQVRGYGVNAGNPHLNDKGFVDSGCSRHMTGNIAYLSNFKEFNGGNVTFGGGAYGGRISGKGTLKTDSLDFDDVYFVKELNFNLFSVSQMCDKRNYVLFTDTECLVLSPDFKLPDENQTLLRIPREDNMYSFNMRNIVPKESLTCLAAKATLDELMLWHRRLGHINFKNINKLVKENLVRGFPLRRFEKDQTCVACLKRKQHRASCKSKVLNLITKPLFMLHMDLFGPTFVSSLMHKKYYLVITNDYSRFTWVFFLATKDETTGILKNFIKEIENQMDKKVKIIICDNGTEFKNSIMDDFCKEKCIRREYSVARAKWKAVSTACYVQNRVLIVKPHNKTPYELFRGFKPALNFMKPFGCHVTIINTLYHLGKFDGKSDEGFFVGYSLIVKLLGYTILEPGRLKKTFMLVTADTSFNDSVGTQRALNTSTFTGLEGTSQECIIMPIWKDTTYFDSTSKDVSNNDPKPVTPAQEHGEDGSNDENDDQDKSVTDSSPKEVNIVDSQVTTAGPGVNIGRSVLNTAGLPINTAASKDKSRASPSSEATHLEYLNDEDEPQVNLGNIPSSYTVPTTPHTRVHINHPLSNAIAKNHEDLHTYLFACFLLQEEQKRISKALSDPAWVEAMQEELLQNKKDERGIVIKNKVRLVAQEHTQKEGIHYDEVFAPVATIKAIRLFLAYASFMGFIVYQLDVKSDFIYGQIEEELYVCQPLGFEDPDYPNKVYKVIKALYGLHQAPKAWFETLANYLLGNGFHRGKIDQTLFIKRKKGDILLVQIYVDDIVFGSTKKDLCTEFEKLMKDKFQMSSIGELTFFLGLQVQQRKDGIFISQDKYVDEILRKFNYTDVKSTSTPVDLEKPLMKDGDGTNVNEHLYRSMIRYLMYLTASKPDIMFVVCACARFQVVPKASHLLAVKRIFRYLKGKPTLGLWYPRDSSFELVAYTDSDYAGATQDRKSTTGGCQFLGNRLISWQYKKQTVVATSTTEVEYVAAANCCGQVL